MTVRFLDSAGRFTDSDDLILPGTFDFDPDIADGVRNRMIIVTAATYFDTYSASPPSPQISNPSYSGGGSFTSAGYSEFRWSTGDGRGWRARIYMWYMEDPAADSPSRITCPNYVSTPGGYTQYISTRGFYLANARYGDVSSYVASEFGSPSSSSQFRITNSFSRHEGFVVGGVVIFAESSSSVDPYPDPPCDIDSTSLPSEDTGYLVTKTYTCPHSGASWKEQICGVDYNQNTQGATRQIRVESALVGE